eukprot:gene5020-8618_t
MNTKSLAVPFGIQNPSKTIPDSLPPDEIYENCLSEKYQHQLKKYIFSEEQYIKFYEKYDKEYKTAFKRAMRIMIQIGTIEACLRGKYYLPNGENVHLNLKNMLKSVKSTKMYNYKTTKFKSHSGSHKTKIMVIEGDCLESGIWLKEKKKLNPIVLIMASSNHPGGGYLKGAGAQEENLFRRTNLFQCTEDPYQLFQKKSWDYPLPEYGGLYIQNATAFRHSEKKGYKFMKTPQEISFVASYSYKLPPIEISKDNEERISSSIIPSFLKKMESIFEIALENGHDSIVLSAFGCGAYCCPPKHIAELFKQ